MWLIDPGSRDPARISLLVLLAPPKALSPNVVLTNAELSFEH